MTSEPTRGALPFTAAGRVEAPPPGGFVLRRDDFGAFRAIEPGTNDLLVLRPTSEGLSIELPQGRELVPWSAVLEIELTFTEAGRAKVPTVRVRFASGPSLDWADALAPGADGLPLTLGVGCNRLLRVERCRMLTAVVASAAGLAPETTRSFRRGPRGVPVPELATRPRVLPQWAPPLLLVGSVVALAYMFDWRWVAALLVMGVVTCHEIAHALVMRLCGMKVRGVLFVPLFGAATVPEHSFSSRWDEARVTLAGPASGLPMAGVLLGLFFLPGRPAWLDSDALGIALVWALGINVLNLIPVLPLDGGRVLGCLAAGMPHVVRAVLVFLPIAALAAAVIVLTDGNGLVFALVFLGLSVSVTRTTLRRQRFLAWMERLPQPLAAVRSALRDVTHAFGGRAREDADGGVPPAPLTGGQTVAVVAMYGVESASLVVAVVAFLLKAPFVRELFGNGG